LEQSLVIKRYDIDHMPYKSILYIDGEFLVPIRTNPDVKNVGNYNWIVNLSNGGKLTEIPLNVLYPCGLLENFENAVYDSIFKPPNPKESTLFWHADAPGYADVLFVESSLMWRWYYKVESYMPLQLTGLIITHHRDGERSNLYFNKTEEHIFAGGRLLRRPLDSPEFNGLVIGVYPSEGGEEQSFFRLFNSNQITYAKINGETWFAKNTWTFDYNTREWNFNGKTEAYILDELNVKLYLTTEDSTVILVQ